MSKWDLDVCNAAYEVYSEGQRRKVKGSCLLVYISAGSGLAEMDGNHQSISEGQSLWLTEGCLQAMSSRMNVYTLNWEGCPEQVLEVPLTEQPPARIVPLWEELLRLHAQRQDSFSDRCRFHAAAWALLSELTERASACSIEETISLIQTQLSQPYSVAELASKAGMTPASFTRAFRRRMGLSPKEFMNRERMKAAKELMVQHHGLTTKDIALRIGLQDEFYFSRLFKKKEGIPPTVYMKRVEERIAVVSQLFLQDHVLALGMQPVAAPAYPTQLPAHGGLPVYLARQLEGTLLLNAEKPFQYEQILQAAPSCILQTELHAKGEQDMAWTHRADVLRMPRHETWNGYLREIGFLFHKETMVEKVEQDIQQLEQSIRDRLCPFTRKGRWAVVWIRAEELRLYGQGQHACSDLLFQGLGFEVHPNVPACRYKQISIEELLEVNPSKLLVLWSREVDVLRIMKHPQWQKLAAFQAGQIYYPNSLDWDPWGPFGRKHMLQSLAAYFASQHVS